MQRRHSDALAAGLIFVGAPMVLMLAAHSLFELSPPLRFALWLMGTFGAAHVARRLLPALDGTQTVVAAAVAILLALGTFAELSGDSIRPHFLVAAMLGAIAGALTSRHRMEKVAMGWRIAAGGLGSFGALVAGGGLTLLLDLGTGPSVLVLLGAGILGAFVVGYVGDVSGGEVALGLAIATVLMVNWNGDPGPELGVGLFAALFCGAGGKLGSVARAGRRSPAKIPPARVRG